VVTLRPKVGCLTPSRAGTRMSYGMETRTSKLPDRRTNPDEFAGKHIHLIGIGGTGMRALARVLLDRGAVITGSDQSPSGCVDRLIDAGARIAIGQRPQNIPESCRTVVYSAAIHDQNPELIAARARKCEVVKYSEMLGRLMADRVGVAIAGTHGKSTTTAMISYVLSAAGTDPSFVVGATVEQLGGPSGSGSGEHFVVEACEFDRNFLDLCPRLAGILNVEEDHLDCYQDIDAIIEAFRAFAAGIPSDGVLVVNAEDRNALAAAETATAQLETFSLEGAGTWCGTNPQIDRGVYSIDVLYRGEHFASLRVPLPGRHNASNALGSVALLYHCGMSGEQIANLLPRFTGAYRRMTLKGRKGGVTVLDDYAHHPTEIQTTLHAIRDHYEPKRLFCVFQPHQHSRTRFLLNSFARSFAGTTEVIVPDIYFVRDSELEKDHISSRDLVSQIRLNGGRGTYLRTFEEIARYLLARLRDGDLVVTMGAGNVWEIADEIVRGIGRDR